MNILISFFVSNADEIWRQTLVHMELSFTAVGFACLVGIPVGFLAVRQKALSSIVTTLANMIQTIPSLALFAFAMPLFGIGREPAIFALFLYGLLPIIKNTMLGINNVNPAVIKAATGMGMTRSQVMLKVQIPLAIPVIMGGVRIAAVTSIGIATIATLIGAGGLGTFIYQGLGMTDMPMIMAGAITSALLAIFVDTLLSFLERALTSKGVRSSQVNH